MNLSQRDKPPVRHGEKSSELYDEVETLSPAPRLKCMTALQEHGWLYGEMKSNEQHMEYYKARRLSDLYYGNGLSRWIRCLYIWCLMERGFAAVLLVD